MFVLKGVLISHFFSTVITTVQLKNEILNCGTIQNDWSYTNILLMT
uniref:Uncharacterized protein n=1 Tax=Ciona intestinalis TaxID=7719 RepID=H2XWS3_CIOIN